MKTMKKIHLLKIIALMLFVSTIYACSDSGSGSENKGEAPNIPTVLESISVDISYFQNNTPDIKQNVAVAAAGNFNMGKIFATRSTAYIAIAAIQTAWVSSLRLISDPKFENGQWVWVYSFSDEEVTLSYKLTSQESGSGGYNWNFYITISGSDSDLDNALAISGTTSADGAVGSWTLYNIYGEDPSQQILTSNYSVESENKKTVSVDFKSNNSGESLSMDYTQNVDVFDIVYSNSGGENYTIHWNTTSMEGYYLNGDGAKHCWDSSFQDVACG